MKARDVESEAGDVESARTGRPVARALGFNFGALTGPAGWAAPRPVHPDGTPAPGAFDPHSWWLRYRHRFAPAAPARIESPTRAALLGRIRRHLPGVHRVVVSSLPGGLGRTTVSAALGLTLAQHRSDRVVVIDANPAAKPDAVTLADRLTGEIGVTVRQLLENVESIDSFAAVSHYTSSVERLRVLSSERDPAMSEALGRTEHERVCEVLGRFFNIVMTDCGTELVHSAMRGTLALAESLVVVGPSTVDEVSRASRTLDWLAAYGFAEQVTNAVVVLSGDRVRSEGDDGARDRFLQRCRGVVEVPFDPHLAVGGRVDLGLLRSGTRDAFEELGALVADEFAA